MYKEGLNFSQLGGLQKLCGIYRLSVEEHSYIGSSKNLYARLREHRTDLMNKQHTNDFLQKVANKYGLEAFCIDIIELCDVDKRIEREAYWIKELNEVEALTKLTKITANVPKNTITLPQFLT